MAQHAVLPPSWHQAHDPGRRHFPIGRIVGYMTGTGELSPVTCGIGDLCLALVEAV